jgi:MarR family transcriptional regulator, organic hydroperoxide resistance regulator
MFDRCLYFNLNVLNRKVLALWEDAFASVGLSPAHGYMLRLVLDRPGLSQQEIANDLGLEKSTVARFVSRLEAKGLVRREAGETDPRQKAVYPTAAAIELAPRLREIGDELYASMSRTFGLEDLRTSVNLLRSMAADFPDAVAASNTV